MQGGINHGSRSPVSLSLHETQHTVKGFAYPGKTQCFTRFVVTFTGRGVQAPRSGYGQRPDFSASIPSRRKILNIRQYLLENSLAQSTRKSYRRSIQLYSNFHHYFHLKSKSYFPISASRLSKFISFLAAKKYKAASIQSILSGLSYIHVLNDWPNPVNHCLIKKMLLGSKRVRFSADSRLPITKKILRAIMKSASRLFPSLFEQALFRAMYSLAFHALLRVSEYTTRDTSNHVIQLQAVNFQARGPSICSCTIRLQHYKHSLKPVTLSIAKSSCSAICPVRNLLRYCRMRGPGKGPLFINEDKSAVTSRQLSRGLRISIEDQRLAPHLYTPHSFRIGGASFAQECNYSESRIQSEIFCLLQVFTNADVIGRFCTLT